MWDIMDYALKSMGIQQLNTSSNSTIELLEKVVKHVFVNFQSFYCWLGLDNCLLRRMGFWFSHVVQDLCSKNSASVCCLPQSKKFSWEKSFVKLIFAELNCAKFAKVNSAKMKKYAGFS